LPQAGHSLPPHRTALCVSAAARKVKGRQRVGWTLRTSCRLQRVLLHPRPSSACLPRAPPSLRRAPHRPGQGAVWRSGACCSAFDSHSSRSRTPGRSSYPPAPLLVRQRPRSCRQEPQTRPGEPPQPRRGEPPQPRRGEPPQHRGEPAQEGRPSSSPRRRCPPRPPPPPRPACASPRPDAARWPTLLPLAQSPPPPRCLPPSSHPPPRPSCLPPWTLCKSQGVKSHPLVCERRR
jgi:hypothetical protein